MSITNRQSRRELGRKRANARWRNHVPLEDHLNEDDAYYRMLEDRRGFVVRAGADYSVERRAESAEVVCRGWCVRYAVKGRTDQFEGGYWKLADGRWDMEVLKRGGARVVAAALKRRKR